MKLAAIICCLLFLTACGLTKEKVKDGLSDTGEAITDTVGGATVKVVDVTQAGAQTAEEIARGWKVGDKICELPDGESIKDSTDCVGVDWDDDVCKSIRWSNINDHICRKCISGNEGVDDNRNWICPGGTA